MRRTSENRWAINYDISMGVMYTLIMVTSKLFCQVCDHSVLFQMNDNYA